MAAAAICDLPEGGDITFLTETRGGLLAGCESTWSLSPAFHSCSDFGIQRQKHTLDAVQLCVDNVQQTLLWQIVGTRIINIQSNRDGEFEGVSIRDRCKQLIVLLSYSPAHQSQSNGLIERTLFMKQLSDV